MITIRQDALLLNLLSSQEARYIPKADDRHVWAMLDRSLAMEIIERAQLAQKLGIPPMRATLFGSDEYRKAYIARVEALKAMTLGTCAQGNASFVPAMTDLIYAICEQSSWSLTGDGGLPDYENSTIDVHACETGALLAFVSMICKNQLDTLSPMIVNYISRTLTARLIDPLINWEGVKWSLEGATQARAVSALVAVALTGESDDRRRWLCLRRALSLLDACIKNLPENGGFTNGLENHLQTTLALDDCFSMLWAASAGAVEMRDEQQFALMAQSIVDMHVAGEYFVNPSGESQRPMFDTDQLFRLGVDARLNSLCQLASYLRRLRGYDPNMNAGFAVPTAPIYQQIMNSLGRSDIIQQPARVERSPLVVKRDMRFLSCRMDGFYASLSGCAGETKYPAVGDFTLFSGDEPLVMGISSDKPRVMCVPTINGQDQIPKPACDIDCGEGAGYQMLSMNIAPAFPAKAGVSNWQRTVMLAKYESSVRLMDVFDFESPASVTFRFMLRHMPRVSQGVVEFAGVTMQFDPSLAVRVDTVPLAGSQTLHRLELYVNDPIPGGNYTFVFRS